MTNLVILLSQLERFVKGSLVKLFELRFVKIIRDGNTTRRKSDMSPFFYIYKDFIDTDLQEISQLTQYSRQVFFFHVRKIDKN